MKNILIVTILLFITLVAAVIADPGIPKVNEVQGLKTTTTVIGAGNFKSDSTLVWTISNRVPITDIPGPNWTVTRSLTLDSPHIGKTIYQTVYTEDTQNSGAGYLSYDKDLDVQTENMVRGQYNVKAIKQVTYLGIDASSVITNDYLMLDGAGIVGFPKARVLCPLQSESTYPTFCNKIETGSTMNLKVANLNTQLGERFVMSVKDSGVEVLNNVDVSSYAKDLPSKGSAAGYIQGSIKEARATHVRPFETITYSDNTAISGDISNFAKAMRYTSKI